MVSLADLLSLLVLPLGALIFFAIYYFMRGQFWWAILSALLWILFGYHSISTIPIFAFERELGIVWIVVGIAVLFMPVYWKKDKDMTLMEQAELQDEETLFQDWLDGSGRIAITKEDKEQLKLECFREDIEYREAIKARIAGVPRQSISAHDRYNRPIHRPSHIEMSKRLLERDRQERAERDKPFE